jgi:tetratricopeptide (TPR) repeat protein
MDIILLVGIVSVVSGVVIVWHMWRTAATYEPEKSKHRDDSIYSPVHAAQDIHYAEKAIERQDYDIAAEFCSRVLEKYPNDLDALRLRSTAYYALGQYDAVLHDLKPLDQLMPFHPRVYALRGFIFIQFKEFDKALENFERAIEYGGEVHHYLNLAWLYGKSGHLDKAIALLKEAIDGVDEPEADLFNSLGWTYSLAGHYPEALENLNKALELDPELVYGYGTRGHTYFLMGKYPEALADFVKSGELKPDHNFAIAGQAITHHAAGNIEEARKLWHKLIDMDARYISADTLAEEWCPAEAFVDEARKIVAALDKNTP